MGLDWNPGTRPKPGCEAQFETLVQAYKMANQADQEALIERIEEISIAPHETLDPPRVGRDAAADQWAREYFQEQDPDITEEQLEANMREAEGIYIFELLPPCDGVPRYTNAPMGYVEAYSFRAQFLVDCTDIIGEDLLEQAFEIQDSKEFLAFGEALIEKAELFARENSLDIENLGTAELESPEARLDVVLAAGRWCVFWAQSGHFLVPYW